MKIDFEFATQHGVFRDALYLDDDHQLSESEITELKQERLDSWLYILESPSISEPETVEIDGVLYEKVYIEGQIVLKPIDV